MKMVDADGGRTDAGSMGILYYISSPCEPNGSGELKTRGPMVL